MKNVQMELLEFIKTQPNVSLDFVERAKRFQGDIYLYGAGCHLPFAIAFMQKYALPIKGILDSYSPSSYYKSPDKDSCNGDIPITSLDDFLRKRDPSRECLFVISAPSAEKNIRETIGRYFPQQCVTAFEMELYIKYVLDVEEYRGYLLSHWSEFSSFYDSLSDDVSRRTFESVIRGRITGNLSYFQQCCVPNQYYPTDIIHFSAGEVMVELGGYTGQTLLQFIQLCPDYRAVYCFEPDKDFLPGLEDIQKTQAAQGKRVHIIPKGAWSSATELPFSVGETKMGDSHILGQQEEPSYTIETAMVDEEVLEPISYMKMDIEGSELQALRGAKKQIVKNHPTLAVCVYHKIEDILEIWNYLRTLVPDYRFYLRHHMCSGSETVLYAVPGGKTAKESTM